MEDSPIRFRDGASYEAMMGGWSRLVGELFLDWLRPAPNLEWIDVGCGTGAFTNLIVEHCSPKTVLGLDPSEAQLDFARTHGLGSVARFEAGDAMALNAGTAAYDVAVAALVVHFMPDPARGVAEMARAVRPGGRVTAYAWDLSGGGFPYDAMHVAMRSLGRPIPRTPKRQTRRNSNACGERQDLRLSSSGNSRSRAPSGTSISTGAQLSVRRASLPVLPPCLKTS
jgi:SAM-dependent methyltransferase